MIAYRDSAGMFGDAYLCIITKRNLSWLKTNTTKY